MSLLIVLLSCVGVSRAQIQNIDSLEAAARVMLPDTSKVLNLNNIAGLLRERDNTRAFNLAVQARDLAVAMSYRRGFGNALEHLGWILYRKGDFSTSLEYSLEALAISKELKDERAMARCLNGIASINIEQNQREMAISNFRRAYELSKKRGDKLSMARSLCNIGYCYLGLKQTDSARFYSNKGLNISLADNKPYITGFALRTLGDIDIDDKKFKEGLAKYNRVFVIADSLQNNFLRASTLHRIGRAYFLTGYPDRAINYLITNIEIARKSHFKGELERTLKLLSEVYESQGHTDKALRYQSEYLVVHDSLNSQRSDEQLAMMQGRFDSEMKEAKIKLLTQEAQIKEEQINRQRLWTLFSVGCFSLMAILAFVLSYNNRINKKTNNELEVKNDEIQSQARQLKNLNVTKDKLFSIISHDLRSPLASLRGLMDIMGMDGLTKEEFVASSKTVRRSLESVQEDLDNLLAWAQSQLNGLQSNPTSHEIKPVIDEKIHLYSELARSKQITIVNDVDHAVSVVADRNHIALVIRNLLGNAIKFNRPGGEIRISGKTSGSFAEISVSDSGVGMTKIDLDKLFNAQTHFTRAGTQQEKGAGIGLLLTKEFVEKNGGSIRAVSEYGKGSTFTFTVKQNPSVAAQV